MYFITALSKLCYNLHHCQEPATVFRISCFRIFHTLIFPLRILFVNSHYIRIKIYYVDFRNEINIHQVEFVGGLDLV